MRIVRLAVRYFRYPVIVILFLFFILSLLNKVTTSLSSAFSSICYAPGFGLTPICKWVTQMALPPGGAHGPHKVTWADYQNTFEQLAEDSPTSTSGTSGSNLSLYIKKAEMATADLIALIRLSDLHFKNSLVDTLSEFIQDARIAGTSLRRLDSQINGVIADVRVIDLAMEAIYANLDRLEEKLSTLRDIVAQENKMVGEAKEELLANLWTMLGGNRKDLRNLNRNLNLLHDLTLYRKRALAHVVATLHALQSVSQDVEDMREGLAAPNLRWKHG
ncbi:hypothetical protein EST38_g9519 [Candolleomyces aberdarensis]|uniref:Uncharacterized protein n=1 Tax=Candolleomyces aberdarensis TaxID=2316362 RepID=A0A4Q2DCY8_9AGAR|nr:hypothetical protein EST38_g9519 [Candolleomyces aberdarensis]